MIQDTYKFIVIILFATLIMACASQTDEKLDNNSKSSIQSHQTTQSRLEQLMDSVVNITDPSVEKQVFDEIWQHTYTTEIKEDSDIDDYSLSLSVVDSIGKQVVNNLQSARGRITVKLTVSNSNKNWIKTISFTPIEKDNLNLLMRE